MRQVARRLRDGSLELLEVPDPVPGPRFVAVRVEASLISSGTERATLELARKNLLQKARRRPDQVRQVLDRARSEGVRATVELVRRRLDELGPLGYSAAGVAVAVGSGVRGVQPGERVAIAGGGHANHAELDIVPELLCTAVPEVVSSEQAAFTTLGAIAMQGFRRADVAVGSTIFVIGLGLIGQLAVRIAVAAGCSVVGVDLRDDLLELAAAGEAEAVNRARVGEPVQLGGSADAVLICAAAPGSDDPVRLAGELARDRAPVVVVGDVLLDLPRLPYYEKELDLRLSRSYGPGRYDDAYEVHGNDYPIGYVRWTEQRNMESFLGLVAAGRVDVDPLVSHRFAIDDAEEAFALLTSEGERPLGVLLDYGRAGDGGKSARGTATEGADDAGASESPSPGSASLAASPAGAKPRFGIAGAGSFATGTVVPGLIEAGMFPQAVASASGLSATDAQRRFGFAAAEGDGEQLLARDDLDLLVIATQHDSHAALAAAALRRGIPVYVEKPLALTLEELREVQRAQRSSGAPLWVGFNRAYAPTAAALVQLEGPRLMSYRINAGPVPVGHWTNDPSRGGGRLLGEGCHFVDFLCAQAGSDPVTVSAAGFPSDAGLPLVATDNFDLQIRFADGSIGSISYAADSPKGPGKERFETSSPGAYAVIDDFRSATIWRGRERERVGGRRRDKGWRAQYEAIAAALAGGGQRPEELDRFFVSSLATLVAARSLQSGEPEPILGAG
ncbi:MAG TPA: Gfo/Idh/MocA family oxidoreductase [Polyangia bacterium]|nr:Gfo/Idh/MocA family oxidoreductase [Polyangia bacterium]